MLLRVVICVIFTNLMENIKVLKCFAVVLAQRINHGLPWKDKLVVKLAFTGGGTMEKLSQEYILSIIFNHSVEREELMLEKYRQYFEINSDRKKNPELCSILKEFEDKAREHIALLKDKMIKLNIQG